MAIATIVGYVLAGLLAGGIIFLGARFLIAPGVAAAGYGVPAEQPSSNAYLSVKGVRDIATGLVVVVLMIAGATHLLGWVMLAATVIPVGDALIVRRSGGSRGIAWGVHGATAAVMLVTTALLLVP
ncbi:MAG: DUF4267 domain-containing protein [Rhodococcus sp. (in: high G+C Gram-positive bacteria)]